GEMGGAAGPRRRKLPTPGSVSRAVAPVPSAPGALPACLGVASRPARGCGAGAEAVGRGVPCGRGLGPRSRGTPAVPPTSGVGSVGVRVPPTVVWTPTGEAGGTPVPLDAWGARVAWTAAPTVRRPEFGSPVPMARFSLTAGAMLRSGSKGAETEGRL